MNGVQCNFGGGQLLLFAYIVHCLTLELDFYVVTIYCLVTYQNELVFSLQRSFKK